MEITHNITVDETEAGERLDKWLARQFGTQSRSRLKALITDGCVRLSSGDNAVTVTSPSRSVKPGEVFQIVFPEPEDPTPQPEAIPLDIPYEDEHLIVVNKPAGMVVHPAPGAPHGTLVNALLHHCAGSLSGIGGVRRPGIVHRIDKDTSGLLVIAKGDQAHIGLAAQFKEHSVNRRYFALCKGMPRLARGRIEGAIGRHTADRKKMAVTQQGGKWAVTHYEVLHSYVFEGYPIMSALECKLETGRTHQVRVHMAHTGHPLIGDPVYAGAMRPPAKIPADIRGALMGFKRQALHARSLGFKHPLTGQDLYFECDIPHDIQDLCITLDQLRL